MFPEFKGSVVMLLTAPVYVILKLIQRLIDEK